MNQTQNEYDESIQEYINSLDEIENLARMMKNIKDSECSPVFLVLGAGSSISSGCKSGWNIVKGVINEYCNSSNKPDDSEAIDWFWEFFRKSSNDTRYHILARYLKGNEPSVGYYCLAELIDEGYFANVILTCNFDIFLEEALQSIGLIYPKDFTVLIPDYHCNEKLLTNLKIENFPKSYIRILKLHGDLYGRVFKLIPRDTFNFPENLKSYIQNLLGYYTVVVGYSMSYNDFDVISCFDKRTNEMWYINPIRPEKDKTFARLYKEVTGDSFRIIDSHAGEFDEFFVRLHSHLISNSKVNHDKRICILQKGIRRLLDFSRISELNSEKVFELVERDFNLLLSLDFDGDSEIFFEMGGIYENLRDYSEAIEKYSKAIELSSDNDPSYYFNRGYCYIREYETTVDSESDKIELLGLAVDDFQKTLTVVDGEIQKAIIYFMLAETHKYMGENGEPEQYNEAIDLYGKAIDQGYKQTSMCIFNRALCYIYIQEYNKAVEDFQLFLEDNPNDDDAIFWLDRAKSLSASQVIS